MIGRQGRAASALVASRTAFFKGNSEFGVVSRDAVSLRESRCHL